MTVENDYTREAGYAERYRDARFTTGTGPRTHRREVRAIRGLLACAGPVTGPWLDVPAGAGRLTELLPGPAYRVDRDPAMLRACPPGGPRVCASALALPWADAAFAGVLCMRLLQHLPAPAQRVACLTELRRVSRGPVIVSYFDTRSWSHLRRRWRRWRGRRASGRNAIPGAEFARELDLAGLCIVAVRPRRGIWSEQRVVLARRR